MKASLSIERVAMHCSAVRLTIACNHWVHFTKPHLLVACSVIVRVYLDVTTLGYERSCIIPAAEWKIISLLSHALGSQLVREIGDPIADMPSLVLDRQHERD
jgi:NAD/NADP transhydrogenase beta subunit